MQLEKKSGEVPIHMIYRYRDKKSACLKPLVAEKGGIWEPLTTREYETIVMQYVIIQQICEDNQVPLAFSERISN